MEQNRPFLKVPERKKQNKKASFLLPHPPDGHFQTLLVPTTASLTPRRPAAPGHRGARRGPAGGPQLRLRPALPPAGSCSPAELHAPEATLHWGSGGNSHGCNRRCVNRSTQGLPPTAKGPGRGRLNPGSGGRLGAQVFGSRRSKPRDTETRAALLYGKDARVCDGVTQASFGGKSAAFGFLWWQAKDSLVRRGGWWGGKESGEGVRGLDLRGGALRDSVTANERGWRTSSGGAVSKDGGVWNHGSLL